MRKRDQRLCKDTELAVVYLHVENTPVMPTCIRLGILVLLLEPFREGRLPSMDGMSAILFLRGINSDHPTGRLVLGKENSALFE